MAHPDAPLGVPPMTKLDEGVPDTEAGIVVAHKERRCLVCGLQFLSEGPGERVCRKCKTKPSWRTGTTWPSGGRPT